LLGNLSALPFAVRWQYRFYTIEGIIPRGQAKEITVSTYGWMNQLYIITTDAYGTVAITPLTPQQSPTVTINPQIAKDTGDVIEDPSGWAMKYYRPNRQSTFGVYVINVAMGFHGSPLPFIPPIKVQILLPENSTQASAQITAGASVIETTSKELFLKSLKELKLFE